MTALPSPPSGGKPPPLSDVVPPPEEWWLLTNTASNGTAGPFPDPATALCTTAWNAKLYGVAPGALRAVARELNRRQCSPPLDDERVEAIVQTVLSTQASAISGVTASTAIHAFVACVVHGAEFRASQFTLRVRWGERPIDRLRLRKVTVLEEDLMGAWVCGPLDEFCRTIHAEATPFDLLQRLKHVAHAAADTERDDRPCEETTPVRFAHDCLHANVRIFRTKGSPMSVPLVNAPDNGDGRGWEGAVYVANGLALIRACAPAPAHLTEGRVYLLVNSSNLQLATMYGHSEWGHTTGRHSTDIARLCVGHPGYVGLVRFALFRGARWHAIAMPEDFVWREPPEERTRIREVLPFAADPAVPRIVRFTGE
jgi:hypothetical protein